MSIWVSVLIFVVGIVLVVKCGDWFVEAASRIAKAAKIPAFIIGATIVSFATTMPELIVSVMATIQGSNDMAIGNAVGSVTANTGLIMALSMVFLTIIVPRKRFMKQCLLLIAAAFVLWMGSLTGMLAPWASIVLGVIFVTFMTLNVLNAKKSPEEAAEEVGSDTKPDKQFWLRNIGMFVVGAAGIVLGSQCLINGGTAIATVLGVPERVIAVTMVAIGTSLPELVTTITAIRKKESHLSVGNIIGANIIDLTMILPICSLISGKGFAVSAASLRFDLPMCFGITLIALVPMLWKERAYKAQGIFMLAAYVAYLVLTL